MIVHCDGCGKAFQLDDSKLAGRQQVQLRCPSCNTVFTVANPGSDAAGNRPAPQPTDPGDRTSVIRTVPDTASSGPLGGDVPLVLPAGKRISLAVLSGPAQGEILRVGQPRVTIGRSDADIVLDDPEASRNHAALEIYGDRVVLRDLGSTNGTFVAGRKIETTEIEAQGEFQIGTSRMMLIVTVEDE